MNDIDLSTSGTQVIDNFRIKLWGETVGTILRPMGPYRVQVEWPDERGIQLEKIADLVKA